MIKNKLPRGYKIPDDQLEIFFRSDPMIMRHIRKITRTAVRQDIFRRIREGKGISNRFFFAFPTYNPVDGRELTPNQIAYLRKTLFSFLR